MFCTRALSFLRTSFLSRTISSRGKRIIINGDLDEIEDVLTGNDKLSETPAKPIVTKPIDSEPVAVELLPKVKGSFIYAGFNAQYQLTLSLKPNSDLQMKRFETDQENVMRLSDLMENVFLTGRFKGENIVRGEFIDGIRDEADHWYVRPVPDSKKGEVLLQFYELGFRSADWQKKGHFFIIDVDFKNPHQSEFKLGDYGDAKEKGIFIINTI